MPFFLKRKIEKWLTYYSGYNYYLIPYTIFFFFLLDNQSKYSIVFLSNGGSIPKRSGDIDAP